MGVKNTVTIGLLLFVAATVVVIVGKNATRQAASSAATNPDDEGPTTDAASLPPDGLVAYYFHGNVRCVTCRNIESYAHEAITTRFTAELDANELTWRIVNYELPENVHFVEQYGLIAPTVVLVRMQDGQDKQWKNLVRVWELVSEKDAFVDYIEAETGVLLEDPATEMASD